MILAAAALQAGAVALGAALGAILRWQASLRLGFVVPAFRWARSWSMWSVAS